MKNISDEREQNLTEIECRRDAADLLRYAIVYDKKRDEKPGEFFNKIKCLLQHPEKLKVHHFPRMKN